MTPIDALQAKLAAFRPRSLLYLSAQPALGIDAGDTLAVSVRSDVSSVDDLDGAAQYDCALLADFLEHLPKGDALAVVGRLRNLHAGRVLVFIDHAAARDAWTLDDFLALGFRQDAAFPHGEAGAPVRTLTLYSYDIATYNHEREWNNPRFWANPELWGKYFW